MEESENKSDLQERWRRGCKQLPPDMLTASDVQAVLDKIVRKVIPSAWPETSRRSGWLLKILPDNRPPCISHKSIWDPLKSCNIDHDYISLLKKIYRVHQASAQTDEERRIKVRWSAVQPAVQHGSPILTEGRNSTVAKEKKAWVFSWVTMIMTASRTWDLPTTWCCSHIQRKDTENVVWIQESNWKSGSQDPSRQDEDSQ